MVWEKNHLSHKESSCHLGRLHISSTVSTGVQLLPPPSQPAIKSIDPTSDCSFNTQFKDTVAKEKHLHEMCINIKFIQYSV